MKTNNNKSTLSQKLVQFFQPGKMDKLVSEEVKQTSNDFKHSVLIVSLFVNAFFMTGWVVLQVTTQFNDDLIAYLSK